MSSHPSTFRGGSEPSGGPGWNNPATLHRVNDGGGVFSSFKVVRSGTLADLVRFVMSLPEDERADYAIEKEGDHRLDQGDIAALSRRLDFPAAD
jgi:hypothetical protein